jgi:hypothetical protein
MSSTTTNPDTNKTSHNHGAEFSAKIASLKRNMDRVDQRITLINNKISEIKRLSQDIQSRKTLYPTDDPLLELQFQISLLTSDKAYLSNIRKSLSQKLNEDFYIVSNRIVLLLSSMSMLDFKDPDTDESILKRLIVSKKILDNNSLASITDMINAISSNLDLVREFIDQFDAYINNMKSKVVNEIYHCAGLHPELSFKRQSIYLEYQKNLRMTENLLNFYHDLSNSMVAQSENMKIADFCGTNRLATPEGSPVDGSFLDSLSVSSISTLAEKTTL